MGSSAAFIFAAFAVILLSYNVVFPVKGQCTVQGCENGESSINIVADMQQLKVEISGELSKQVQSISEILHASFQQIKNLNASLQQMKNQQYFVMTSLQPVDQRSQEQDVHIKQVQSIHDLLNASSQQMKTQHAVAMRRLDVVTQLLLYHDISNKNQTEIAWKLAIGVPVQLNIGIDLGEGPVLLPIVNNWIVLMHRFDGSLNFNRTWTEYRNGFGEIGRGEFWLGNEIVHRLTNRKEFVYTLRIEVQLYTSGEWFYADYDTFSIEEESRYYALHVSGYSGNAMDALSAAVVGNAHNANGMNFSTPDADHDTDPTNSCAIKYSTGWWFNNCWWACLTCSYHERYYMSWYTLENKEPDARARAARMMIRST